MLADASPLTKLPAELLHGIVSYVPGLVDDRPLVGERYFAENRLAKRQTRKYFYGGELCEIKNPSYPFEPPLKRDMMPILNVSKAISEQAWHVLFFSNHLVFFGPPKGTLAFLRRYAHLLSAVRSADFLVDYFALRGEDIELRDLGYERSRDGHQPARDLSLPAPASWPADWRALRRFVLGHLTHPHLVLNFHNKTSWELRWVTVMYRATAKEAEMALRAVEQAKSANQNDPSLDEIIEDILEGLGLLDD